MNKVYRNLLIVCILIIFALLAYLFLGSGNDQNTINRLEEEKSGLVAQLDEITADFDEAVSDYDSCEANLIALEAQNKELKVRIEELDNALKEVDSDLISPLYLNEFELDILKNMGIDDVSAIITDLRNHPEVIVTEAVLGGTMMFEDIYLLNHQYVYATMSDGHIMVVGIYKFTITKDLDFIWESVYEAEF